MNQILIFLLLATGFILASLVSYLVLLKSVFKKAKSKAIAKRYFQIFMTIAMMIFFSCSGTNEIKKENHYLVTVENNKPKKLKPYRYLESSAVDSVVISSFGEAIPKFTSDSIFIESPYFRIETLNKAIYGEEKRRGK